MSRTSLSLTHEGHPLMHACVRSHLQAGDVRTSIGSGLIQLGIPSKATVGLYSINCKGACTSDSQTPLSAQPHLGPETPNRQTPHGAVCCARRVGAGRLCIAYVQHGFGATLRHARAGSR